MAKKRNTIEDYLNELYRRGMAGDEEAQLEFIQVIVMETAAPLEGAPLEWLNALVEKGNTQARRCYFAWAMNGDAADCDWQRLVQWAEELLVEAPGDAHCMLGMLYEPGLPGLADDKLAEEHYRKALDAGNEGCGFYLARVLLGREENDELPYAEARELLERAELTERPARWADNIHSEAARMRSLVEEMLTLARGDNMVRTAAFSDVCLSEVAMDCVLLFEPVAFEAGKPLV